MKLSCPVIAAVLLFLAGSVLVCVSAQNSTWTGLGGDGLWSDANNWSPVGVPASGNPSTPFIGNVTLNADNGWLTMTIAPGQVERPGVGNSVEEYNMIYGPEWGATLNVYGTLDWDYYLAPVQDDPAYPTVVNAYGGSTMSGQGLALGDTWWYWGGPWVTMNIFSNATVDVGYMYWGGEVNLYGGILSITNGLTLDTVDSVSDTTRSMNLAGGELILPNAFSGTVKSWISRGILLAYGKSLDNSDIVVSTTSMPGRTVVTTTPLGGALQDVHLALSSTNITVGDSEFLNVLGDYPGVVDVVLTSLNPATLPGQIAFQSSNTNVAVVTSNSLIIAVAPGSATITATLGAFAGTNSVTVSVTPIPVPVPRLPEEQPAFGYPFAHDPSTMIFDGSRYYVFADGQGISEIYSTDMRNWNYTSPVFPGNPPSWTTNLVPSFSGYFWAPDIVYLNHQYYLYYVCSEWGTIDSGIGLATSPSLTSPVWTDQGEIIGYTNGIAINCIDPSILLDTNNGTMWMSFGSYSDGVFLIQLDPTTGKRLASFPITKLEDNSTNFFSNTTEGSYLYQRGGYYYLFVNWGGCCEGVDSTYNIRVGRSTSVAGPYLDRNGRSIIGGGGSMFLESSGRFIGPGQAAILNLNGQNWLTYHFYDGNNNGDATLGIGQLNWSADGWPVFTNDWSAFYPFNADARDAGGLYNGTLENGAAITNDASLGHVLGLNGTSQYAELPGPVANASTYMAWVKWNGGAEWQRIFDFGNGTGAYLFLTPMASSGAMRFAVTTNGNGAEQRIDAPFPLPTNSWCHVAVTVDGSVGLLYLDGVPIATNNNLTIRPWQTLPSTNYIGHSQFGADPLFNGEISSFRIFGRALSATEIQSIACAPPALAHRYSFSSSNMVWDSVGMAHGALQGSAMITNNTLQLAGGNGNYVNLPGGLVSGSSAVTVEFWATFGVNGIGAPVFDFGDTTNLTGDDYVSFNPQSASNGAQLTVNTADADFNLGASQSFENLAVQVDCIIDPTTGYAAIYTNGTLLASATGAVPPLNSVSPAWSFIGQSLFTTNASLGATLDEFRIYDGRLTPAQIAADNQLGPEIATVPIGLSVFGTGSNLNLTWPAYGIGYTVESSASVGPNAVWLPINNIPALSNNLWQVALPETNSAEFFRLAR